MAINNIPTLMQIEQAYALIHPFIHKTPVLKSDLLNAILGCKLVFKCENFQKAGAFKYRGATHAILNLTDEELKRGVTTHSSGNHAGALAKAAALHNAKAFIVMPENSPKVKIDAVRAYGGKITFCEPTLKARESTLKIVQSNTEAVFIHPYDNFNVICGQGTACLELTTQIEEPDFLIVPVGGGGLLSGTSIVARSKWNKTKVIAAEPKNADDAYQSFESKKLMPPVNKPTLADGLRTALSDLTFNIMLKNVNKVITVKEHTIIEAMKLVFQYLKIVIEPSSAVTLAVVMENSELFKNTSIALIISGGNVDLVNLPF